jgi:hypothetical protein
MPVCVVYRVLSNKFPGSQWIGMNVVRTCHYRNRCLEESEAARCTRFRGPVYFCEDESDVASILIAPMSPPRHVQITPYRAGHVLGAAMFMVEVAGTRCLYTGDYSRTPDRHMPIADVPLVQPDVGKMSTDEPLVQPEVGR